MIGLIVWCIIIIFIAACLLPWRFIPAAVIYFFIVELLRKH
jgi:hypothetical protein